MKLCDQCGGPLIIGCHPDKRFCCVKCIRPPKQYNLPPRRRLRIVTARLPPPPPLPGTMARRRAKLLIWSTYGFALAAGWSMSIATLSFTFGCIASCLVAFAEVTNRLRQHAEDRSLGL